MLHIYTVNNNVRIGDLRECLWPCLTSNPCTWSYLDDHTKLGTWRGRNPYRGVRS